MTSVVLNVLYRNSSGQPMPRTFGVDAMESWQPYTPTPIGTDPFSGARSRLFTATAQGGGLYVIETPLQIAALHNKARAEPNMCGLQWQGSVASGFIFAWKWASNRFEVHSFKCAISSG